MGRRGFTREARTCLLNAAYLQQRLLDIGWPAWRNENSNIVYFKKPPAKICQKWQLALAGDFAHILVMQQVTKVKIEEFVGSLKVKNE
jgi:histidine decarboxylase